MGQVFAVHDEEDRGYLSRPRRQRSIQSIDTDETIFDPIEAISSLTRERDVLLKKVKENISVTEQYDELVSENQKLKEINSKMDADNHTLRKKGLDSMATNEELVQQITKLQKEKDKMSSEISQHVEKLRRDKMLLGEELKSTVEQNKDMDNALSKVKARNERLCKRVQELEDKERGKEI